MSIGTICIWKPKKHLFAGIWEDLEHPWYGQPVKILGNETLKRYRVRPVYAPEVNDPHAFEFCAEPYELEEV